MFFLIGANVLLNTIIAFSGLTL